MALFNRKSKQDALVERLVDAITKANNMAMTPLANSGYVSATVANPSPVDASGVGGQGLLSTTAQANPLPRPATSFGSQLGPAAPFLPSPLDPVFDDSGRALPRLWEFPVAWNLDLNQRTTPWTVLRSMADQIDIIHRAVEIKIAEITKMGWSFEIEDATITSIMADQNVSHAKAAKIARDKYAKQIDDLRKFWENPYPQLGRTFTEWMTEFLWQHMVFDGTPVYARYNLGKEVIGFEIIDSPTIKVLLDNRGAVPSPPSPAYQQILWGFPRGEYQWTPESDGEFYNAPGRSNEYLRDQLAYFVRNRRTWSPYGFSAVEEAVPAATLYLDRQQWMKSEYRDGSMPMAFFETDSEEMDPTHLAAFERVFNDRLVGSTVERHRMKVLPRGFKPVFAPAIESQYKNEYDEYIILRIATIFGVAPSAMGVVPRSGLGGKGEHQGEAQAALTTSQKPLEAFLIETINTLSRRFLNSDKNITFSFDDDDSDVNQMAQRATAYQTALQSGQMTINDVRGELNMPLYDIEEADEPLILAGNTLQFLTGLLDNQRQAMANNTKGSDDGDQVDGGTSGGRLTEGDPQEGSQEGSTTQPQVKPTQTEVEPTEAKSLMADEIRDFARFVKSRHKRGNWRPFDFSTVTESVAEILNERAYFIVKGVAPMPEILTTWVTEIIEGQITDNPLSRPIAGLTTKRSLDDQVGLTHKKQIEDHYLTQIIDAMSQSISGVDEAISQVMTMMGQKAATDPLTLVKSIVKWDATPLRKVLTNVYREAGYVGTAMAVKDMGNNASLSYPLAEAAATIDWSTWSPGSPVAADLLSGGGLQATLDQLGITIAGIGDTRITRVGNIIGAGVSQGLPAKTIARNIASMVSDPSSAYVVAVTETNRAYCQASVDQYAATGLTEFEWIAYDTACAECATLEGNHPIGDPVPPQHPSCRCTVAAVISN